MKVTYNWLKDFVNIKITPQKLADKLTMAGLEVVSLEEKEGDFIFEIEITSNRPDWLSVKGIAREVAAITGMKLASYPVSQLSGLGRQTGKRANGLTINIEDKKDCTLYSAKIIKDVKVGPSPEWIRKRLELVGSLILPIMFYLKPASHCTLLTWIE
jgi:phenylalanyl-tRNA synthetase beta chain